MRRVGRLFWQVARRWRDRLLRLTAGWTAAQRTLLAVAVVLTVACGLVLTVNFGGDLKTAVAGGPKPRSPLPDLCGIYPADRVAAVVPTPRQDARTLDRTRAECRWLPSRIDYGTRGFALLEIRATRAGSAAALLGQRLSRAEGTLVAPGASREQVPGLGQAAVALSDEGRHDTAGPHKAEVYLVTRQGDVVVEVRILAFAHPLAQARGQAVDAARTALSLCSDRASAPN